MTKCFDLHCHSIFSDGSLTPTELVEKAKTLGLSGLSITDHDTFDGYFEAVGLGLPILPGVEISATFEAKSIHVLGYAFDPHDAAFNAFCLNLRKARLVRLKSILELLRKEGFDIHESDVISTDDPRYAIGRVHIAKALMAKGYTKNILEAFKRLIGDRAKSYVAGEKCTVDEAIDAIHSAKGLAVLAHPHLIESRSLARRLLACKFDGLEAYYGRFQPNVNEHWEKMAKDRGLFVTGGSDFHGLAKPESSLGSSSTPELVFEMLLEHCSK